VSAWNNAPGPQYYHWTAYPSDVWIYLNVSTTGNHDLNSNNYGIAWLCIYPGGYCEDRLSDTADIWYTNVFLNKSTLDPTGSTAAVQWTVAHESGHGMGLAHNDTNSGALMWPNYNGVGGPQGPDWGAYPGCSNGGWGTNCIYGNGD